jgi:hypothetical protein
MALFYRFKEIVGQQNRGVKDSLKTKDFIAPSLKFFNKSLRFKEIGPTQPVRPCAGEALRLR